MNVQTLPANQNSKTVLYSAFGFCAVLALFSLVGAFIPRFMAFMPALMLLIGVGGFRIVSREDFLQNAKLYAGIVLTLLVLATLSGFWALDSAESFSRVPRLMPVILPAIFLPVLIKKLPAQALQFFMMALPLALIVAGLVLAVDFYSGGVLYEFVHGQTGDERFNLSLLNRGVTTMTLGLLVTLPLLWNTGLPYAKKAVLITALVVVCGSVLLKTDSQSAQLATMVGLVFMIIFPYRVKAAWMILGMLIVGLVMSAPWLVQYLFHSFAEQTQGISWLQSGYAADRLEIWDSVARYALQNPLLGFGIEATRVVPAFDTAQIYRHTATVLHPHNFALQIWMEFGAIGAILFSALTGLVLYRLSRLSADEARIALPAIIGFLSVSATGYGLWQGWWVGMAVTLLAAILASQAVLRHFSNVRA